MDPLADEPSVPEIGEMYKTDKCSEIYADVCYGKLKCYIYKNEIYVIIVWVNQDTNNPILTFFFFLILKLKTEIK